MCKMCVISQWNKLCPQFALYWITANVHLMFIRSYTVLPPLVKCKYIYSSTVHYLRLHFFVCNFVSCTV